MVNVMIKGVSTDFTLVQLYLAPESQPNQPHLDIFSWTTSGP